ncbi:MAG: response regulator [Rhodothermales bacterium]
MTTQDHKARILAVEDDLHIQTLLHHFLHTRFDMAFATSIDDALEVAARHPFDLFLLDIHLKERRTGVDLLNELRQMPAFRATPAVACTAYALHGDRDRFLGLGFCGYIAKPFARKKLYETIQDALDHRGKSEPRVFDA